MITRQPEDPRETSNTLNARQLGLEVLAGLLEASGEGIAVVDEEGDIVFANTRACEIFGCSFEEFAGTSMLSHVAERDRERIAQGFAEWGPGKTNRGLVGVVRPSGEEREVEFSTMRIEVEGRTYTAGILRDVTDARRLEREGAALMQITSRVAFGGSLQSTLNAMCEHLVGVTGALASSVILIDPETRQPRMTGMYGLPEGYLEAFNKMVVAGVPLQTLAAMEEGQHRILRNVREGMLKMPHYVPVHRYVRGVEWDTIVALPLSYGGERVGVLLSYHGPAHVIEDAELNFLKAIADQAAVAVQNARLLGQAAEKAALEERQRLARELHDSVSQALYSISLQARTARILYERDPSRLQEPLDGVLALARAAMAEMRALIFELRPGALREEGLLEAIRKHTAGIEARHNLPAKVVCEGESLPRLKPAAEEALYRVVQEALHNVVKHARAGQTEVTVRIDQDLLTLQIADDGVGFDPAQVPAGRMGLGTMAQRAASLHGEYEVDSAPGRGTMICVRVPLAEWRLAA